MKYPKRLFSLLLCVSLLFGVLPPCTAAGAPLKIQTEGGKRGGIAVVEVCLEDISSGIAGGHFNLAYDAENLSVVSAVAGEAAAGCMATVNLHYTVSSLRFTFSGTEALTAKGVLLRVTFRIGDNAPFSGMNLTASEVKLFNAEAETVSRVGAEGMLEVHSVGLSISSQSCLPGQSVSLSLQTSGKLLPSGGEFEICFDERLLTAGTVKAAQKAGGQAINLSFHAQDGCVKVSWASAGSVSAGELCRIVFAVNELAAGELHIRLENVRFFDENGALLHSDTAQPGVISVLRDYNAQPTLYVVGGKLAEDGKTSTVQIAVDGAGLVCGGSASIGFDSQKVRLVSMTKKMACAAVNPETSAGVEDEILVSWAQDTPALDKQAILELQFELLTDSAAELTLSSVALCDQEGSTLTGFHVHDGEIGITEKLQPPVAELTVSESGIRLQATVYDAAFCSEQEKLQSVQVILACYRDGRFTVSRLPENAVTFDPFGVATVSTEIAADAGDQAQFFFLDPDGSMSPMCSAAGLNIPQ